MTSRAIASALRLLMAAAVIAAVITQLANTVSLGDSVSNFFSFFTIQSNVIGAAAVTTAALATQRARRSVWLSQLRGAATLYMGITGLIFSLLLSGADVQTPIPWVNSVLHYVFPLFLVIDWLVERSVRPLTFRQGLVFLSYPVAYLAYTMIRGPIVDWYPYPFIDPRDRGYFFVAVMSRLVAVVGLALAWVLCWTSRRGFGLAPERSESTSSHR